jgi:tetratricopeptide (TPR) repeat protein
VEIARAGPISSRRYTSFLQAFAEGASFVGREEERAALLRGLDRAQGGKGKIFLVEGALGVGKTRISLEIMEAASERGLITLTGSCFEGANPDPFNPFIEAIERALANAGSPEAFRRALGEDARDLARLMPQLRRLFPDIPQEEQVSPEQARRAMFNAVVNLLFRFSVTAPVLLLLEDLHWADEGTLSLLTHIGRSLAQVPIMILGTLRDSKRDLAAPLGRTLDELTRLHILERLSLGGLSRAAVGEMIQSLAKHSPPESLVNLFYETTEGNPLFVEELFTDLVQHEKLLDSDGVFLPEIVISDSEVPQSLRLVLGRKLSALSTNTRNLLTAASVIGRSFTLEELQALTGEDAERLIDCVEEAEGRGIISSTLEERQVRFQFSHQLVRNTVLADVSTVRRQRLHAKYAGALEILHSSDVERKSAEIAQHLVQAGTAADPGKTFQYLTLAARRAMTQSAFEAALSYLQKARAALECVAPSRERDEQELKLYFEYLPVISTLNRWTAPEAGKIYDRARELSHNLGQNQQMYRLLQGSAYFHLGRGELDTAELYVRQTCQLASASGQPKWSTGAQIVLGHVLCCRGQFASAHERLTTAIRLRDSIEEAEPSAKRAKIQALGVDGMVLWMLGYARQAISSGEEAIQLASAANNPFDLVLALTQAHIVAMLARQYGRALDLGDRALALATRVKYEYLQISMTWSRDACRILARVDNNIDAVRNDFERHHAAEAQLYRPTTCTVLAECCGLVGQTEAGLAMLEEAFKCAAATGQRMSDADTWRVKGALLLQLADKAGTANADSLRREAEECFLEGIEVARRQEARSWELRTTLSLSHLLIHSGREKQAKDMLRAAYTRLTEGFDSPDLVEAAQLLRESQPSSRVNRDP